MWSFSWLRQKVKDRAASVSERGLLVFNPSDVVVAARVADCVRVLLIGGVDIASVTGNTVAISSYFKDMLAPG